MASTPRKSAQRKISSPARVQGLTVKQQRAVEKFVATGSMIEAYRCAYACEQMSPKCLYSRAKELFENPRVAARVRALRQQSMDAAVLDRQEALAILSDIARGQISNYLDDDGAIDPRAIKAMGGPDIERLDLHTAQGRQKALLRLRDPIRAIERISKLEGWEETERLGVGQVSITIDTGGPDTLGLRGRLPKGEVIDHGSTAARAGLQGPDEGDAIQHSGPRFQDQAETPIDPGPAGGGQGAGAGQEAGELWAGD